MFAYQDMRSRLKNLRAAGFKPTGAIDGGAYHGGWAKEFWSVWPHCPVILIEPQMSCRAQLEKAAAIVPGSRVISAAISSRPGRALFRQEETNSAIVSDATRTDGVEVEVSTIEYLLHDESQFSANLLKLDLQGHELAALVGAAGSLAQFEVLILEMSLIGIDNAPEFNKVHCWLDANGYRLYDVLPMYYRPQDGALWQVDAFYIRKDSALCRSKQWD